LRRLETMALMGGVDIPHTAIREQIASAVHAVVHVVRSPDGTRCVASVDRVERAGVGWHLQAVQR
jgi:pilus assembly protein CpaF